MRVLVVDDSMIVRAQLTDMLNACDIEDILEAANGVEALDMLSTEDVDLVTLDMHMPEMDGYECLENMKAEPRLAKLSTIIITSDTDKELIKKFTQLGAGAFLRKPFHLDYFVMALTSACPFIEFMEEEEPQDEVSS